MYNILFKLMFKTISSLFVILINCIYIFFSGECKIRIYFNYTVVALELQEHFGFNFIIILYWKINFD